MSESNRQLLLAIELALKAHDPQLDKAGLPYILHPLAVMGAVDGLDAKTVAVLHDVIEDTEAKIVGAGINLGSSWYPFTPHLMEALDAITKRKGEEYRDYLDRVKANQLALRVKLADIAHNMSRLNQLPVEEADRLRSKYGWALVYLKNA